MSNGNGLFVSPRYNSQDVSTSTDGITWTVATAALPSVALWAYPAFTAGVFCITTNGGGSTAATSTNGTIWTARTLSEIAQRGSAGGNQRAGQWQIGGEANFR